MNDYDQERPSTFITYLDKNNLYGWEMSKYLPYGEFRWVKNVNKFDVMSVSEKSDTGYFLEVNLEYPDELHELHNDYPLAPEKFAVFNDMLLAYCEKIADKYGIIPNLGNKTKYVVYYINLQLYLSLGMKLTKKKNECKISE